MSVSTSRSPIHNIHHTVVEHNRKSSENRRLKQTPPLSSAASLSGADVASSEASAPHLSENLKWGKAKAAVSRNTHLSAHP
jgi:hypothetical protein